MTTVPGSIVLLSTVRLRGWHRTWSHKVLAARLATRAMGHQPPVATRHGRGTGWGACINARFWRGGADARTVTARERGDGIVGVAQLVYGISVSSCGSQTVSATFGDVSHLLGYARVSTTEQNPDLQVDELTAAGCWRVWTDHASGALDRRPQLDEVLEQLRPGDTLVVWRLDRLGRSLRHLIDVVTDLDERGVGVPVAAGEHRHHDRRRAAGVPPVRGARPVRAGDHPGPDGRRPDGGSGSWPGRGTAVEAVAGAAPAGPQDVRRARADGRADRPGPRGQPHLYI